MGAGCCRRPLKLTVEQRAEPRVAADRACGPAAERHRSAAGFLKMPALFICELRDSHTRNRFWSALEILGATEINDYHWADVGVEHWTFQIDHDDLTVCEDHGELVIHGSQALLQRLQKAVGECGRTTRCT